MTLRLVVLGSSGTAPVPDNGCSGYLLRTGRTTIWLDCGSGSLAALQRHVPLVEIDGVVCSHVHPDHWLDLPVAVNALRYVLDASDAGIPLLWTAETAAAFDVVSGRSPAPAFAPRVIDAASTATLGDIELSFSRTDHPVETLAVRATAGGRTIVYSADTGDGWDLAATGRDGDGPIDLAVLEATLDEGAAGDIAHLTASQAGRQATRAGVARLLLTHLAPGTDPAQRIAAAATTFDGPIDVATPNQEYPA